MWSNSRQWNDRGNANPLDPICNIRAQQCDAGFHRPDLYFKSTTQRLNWGVHQRGFFRSRENAIVDIMIRTAVHKDSRDHLVVEKCIHSQLTAEMTQEDPDIQILLDHAKDLQCSLLRDKTMLTDDTYYAILNSRGLQRRRNMNLPRPQRIVWLNYQLMIINSMVLIKAYRTGCWLMH